jgi:uncharacterized protein YndB with AHSA1/START domain
MTNNNLSITITVDQTPAAVFAAITNVRGWWSERLEGSSAKVGDVFRYRHGEMHDCTQRVVEAVPGNKVEWLVTDAYLSFTKDKHEWKDTRVVFEITGKPGATELRFTHAGITPETECFEKCSKGWGYFIGQSLKNLIMTGVGLPDRE